MQAELYNIAERHIEYNVSGILDFFRNFPSSIMAEDVLIERSAPNAMFYNITLQGLETPLQAHTVHIECLECSDAVTGQIQADCFMMSTVFIRLSTQPLQHY